MSDFPPATGSSAMENTLVDTVKPKASKAPKPKRVSGRAGGCLGAILNLLTLLFVLLTCLSAALVLALFQTPSPLNYVRGGSAYLPATDPAIAQVLSTPTPPAGTPGASFPTLPPVWTPTDTPTITTTPMPGTASAEPSSTEAVPTYTATPTPTRTATRPTPIPTLTQTKFRYNLQKGTPQYLANFINNSGCNWFGIFGRAFGLDGNPVINLTVHLEGGGINVDVVTGSGPSALGPGGYQIPISDHPIDTTDTYKIQLRNNTGTPLSDIYAIRTYGDCAKNAVMVNFTQNH